MVGAGGHGRVVSEAARRAGFDVVGFVEQDTSTLGRQVAGSTILAVQAELLAMGEREKLPGGADGVALGVGSNAARHALAVRLLETLGADRLPLIVHPAADVSPSARIGPGTVVLPRAVVHTDARIGSAVIVNSAAVVEHDCVLDDAVHVSPGAVLCGGVTVGRGSWIGAGATVIHARTIGQECVVGAGSVVVHDVPSGSLVVGVPARRRPHPAD